MFLEKIIKSFLVLFLLTISFYIQAQTICTTINYYPEQTITTKEYRLKKPAVYKYDIIPEVLPLYEYVTETVLVCDAYDKLIVKTDGTKCITSIPAVYKTNTISKLIRDGQPPQFIKVLVCQAEYETIEVCKKIKDAKMLILNSECK